MGRNDIIKKDGSLDYDKIGGFSDQIGSLSRVVFSVKWYGAIGDGMSHPLSEKYSTLVDAQKIYPHAIALTDEIDWCAIQKGINTDNDIKLLDYSYMIHNPLVYNKDNLKFVGEDATITGDTALFVHKPFSEFVNNKLMTDILVKGITFKTKTTLPFNESGRMIIVGGVDGFTIEECKFIGWNGDAVIVDLAYGNASQWVVNVTKNVKIKNCLFNGVNNENRQAITLFQCSDVIIEGNDFKNTTKWGMPGAIDIEPWQYHKDMVIIQNIIIRNNKFDNIQGQGGAINLFFDTKQIDLTYPLQNIQILNNEFSRCKGDFIYLKQVNTGLTYWDINNIVIKGNIFNGGFSTAWKFLEIYGINGVEVKDNTFNKLHGIAYIGQHRDYPSEVKNINVQFKNNTINDLSPDTTNSWKAVFELGVNDTLIVDGNLITADDGTYPTYKTIIVFRYIPPTSGTTTINYIFRNNVCRNSQTKRIEYFLYDGHNGGVTAPIMNNNILGDIVERQTV